MAFAFKELLVSMVFAEGDAGRNCQPEFISGCKTSQNFMVDKDEAPGSGAAADELRGPRLICERSCVVTFGPPPLNGIVPECRATFRVEPDDEDHTTQKGPHLTCKISCWQTGCCFTEALTHHSGSKGELVRRLKQELREAIAALEERE